jgi:putative endonuclease
LKDHFTYILECSDGTLYTGWTTDIEKRLKTHNAGKGAKYTKARIPVKLMASWRFETRSEAMKWEWFLKRLPRSAKIRLIEGELSCNN